jgi:uncharacterized protein YeaO (DUF488 family)
MSVTIKRVYDPPVPSDGVRVLVDRLWPRGLSKAKAKIDRWEKDLAPSDGLRRWFGHDPAKWPISASAIRKSSERAPNTSDSLAPRRGADVSRCFTPLETSGTTTRLSSPRS